MSNHIEFIGLEDIVAKALLELCKHNKATRVSFDTLMRYGNKVAKSVDGKAVVILSNSYRNNLVIDYADLFEIDDDHIMLAQGKGQEDIKERFSFFYSKDVYNALIDTKALKILGIDKIKDEKIA